MGLPERPEGDKKFQVLVTGALYAGIARGLTADVLTARALGGSPRTVCSAIVAAGSGRVTDVIEVPADSVDAQLEHIFETYSIDAAKIGIAGSPAAAASILRRMERQHTAPFVLDLTLSGPSGEDIASQQTVKVLTDGLGVPDLVTIRRRDAELVAGMEIESLDDAQVAAQRLIRLGARAILIRCGLLPARFFDNGNPVDPYYSDVYFDGEDFALFEGPSINVGQIHGASSALTLSILKNLSLKHTTLDAIRAGKAYVTEALRRVPNAGVDETPNFFWKLSNADSGC